MDWAKAIELNRNALLRVVAALVATAGLVPGGSVITLPRHVRSRVLLVLRPAESAVRRLIVMFEQKLLDKDKSVAPYTARPAPAWPIPRGNGERIPAFPLLDTMKRFDFGPRRHAPGSIPRISVPGFSEPDFTKKPEPSRDDPVDAKRLCQRLESLRLALDDLPRQARRMARWRARRDQTPNIPGRPRRMNPMRPGTAPGYRQRHVHEIDAILRECQDLAWYAMKPPDTS